MTFVKKNLFALVTEGFFFIKLRGNGNVLSYYCNISQICGDKVSAQSASVNDILYISLRYII